MPASKIITKNKLSQKNSFSKKKKGNELLVDGGSMACYKLVGQPITPLVLLTSASDLEPLCSSCGQAWPRGPKRPSNQPRKVFRFDGNRRRKRVIVIARRRSRAPEARILRWMKVKKRRKQFHPSFRGQVQMHQATVRRSVRRRCLEDASCWTSTCLRECYC